jgi:predicted alpha/beta-fold hydrolase
MPAVSVRGHLWTLAPRVRHRLRPPRLAPSRAWETVVDDPQVGAVRVTGRLREAPGSGELLLLVHGLGGSTDSHYLDGGAAAAEAAGISSLRVNLRGSDRQGNDFYHAGLTADLHAALASAELRRYRRIYALGYSLGGHVVLRLATEAGDERLAAAAAVCSPLDLALSQREIDAPRAWLYRRYLVRSLIEIYAAVAARRPVPLPVAAVRRVRTIREWDDLVVAPRHGFADAGDYYARASVAPRLHALRVPALLVNAESDPMVPARAVRPALALPAPRLEVRWIAAGGHVGFPGGLDLGWGERPGVDAQVVSWLRAKEHEER